MPMKSDLAERAMAVLNAARFGQLSASSAIQYVAVASRIEAERDAAGASWAGPTDGVASKRTAAVRRAAWTRRAHREVAAALVDLRAPGGSSASATERLARWVPEAEACRPGPEREVSGLLRGRPPNPVPSAKSKRAGLKELPADWMDVLWQEAVARPFIHLDALSVIMVTGCRPAEVCSGVGVRRVPGGVQVVVRGSKVRVGAGQPWRLLTVALGADGPAAHLASLADKAGGKALVKAACDRNALSMGIAHVAAACLPGRRISAYDLRHQRASDARAAFGGDLEKLAAWLGHAGTDTVRYYAHLPRSGGSRGPLPIAATAARPVHRRVPSTPAADHGQGMPTA